jgi:hypothetical protein
MEKKFVRFPVRILISDLQQVIFRTKVQSIEGQNFLSVGGIKAFACNGA